MMGPTDITLQASQVRAKPEIGGANSIRETAEQFEAFFLARFIDAMQAGIKTDGPFGGGHGEQMFRGMLSDHYADTVVKSGGIGIADAVERELLRIQEAREQ